MRTLFFLFTYLEEVWLVRKKGKKSMLRVYWNPREWIYKWISGKERIFIGENIILDAYIHIRLSRIKRKRIAYCKLIFFYQFPQHIHNFCILYYNVVGVALKVLDIRFKKNNLGSSFTSKKQSFLWSHL